MNKLFRGRAPGTLHSQPSRSDPSTSRLPNRSAVRTDRHLGPCESAFGQLVLTGLDRGATAVGGDDRAGDSIPEALDKGFEPDAFPPE